MALLVIAAIVPPMRRPEARHQDRGAWAQPEQHPSREQPAQEQRRGERDEHQRAAARGEAPSSTRQVAARPRVHRAFHQERGQDHQRGDPQQGGCGTGRRSRTRSCDRSRRARSAAGAPRPPPCRPGRRPRTACRRGSPCPAVQREPGEGGAGDAAQRVARVHPLQHGLAAPDSPTAGPRRWCRRRSARCPADEGEPDHQERQVGCTAMTVVPTASDASDRRHAGRQAKPSAGAARGTPSPAPPHREQRVEQPDPAVGDAWKDWKSDTTMTHTPQNCPNRPIAHQQRQHVADGSERRSVPATARAGSADTPRFMPSAHHATDDWRLRDRLDPT